MLEHANLTVSDPQRSADLLCHLFDWQIRWSGKSKSGDHFVHVGTKESYLALYSQPEVTEGAPSRYAVIGGLNHVGVVVEDLTKVEATVTKAGLTTYDHDDYEPGKRFYFLDADGIEFEVVSYNQPNLET